MYEVEEYQGTLTSKGQVTLPLEIRRLLGLKPHDKVVFRVSDGKVELQPVTMTLEQTFGAVTPINRPENFKELRDQAIEERVEAFMDKMSQ